MTEWSFHNPVRVHGGAGSLGDLPQLLAGEGAVLLVTTAGFRRRGGLARVEALLAGRDVRVLDDVAPNPDLRDLERQIEAFAAAGIRGIVAIGGGSVLDTAKVIAVGLAGGGFSLRGHLLDGEPLPATRAVHLVCVPTTAGTGSEVTPFATVWDLAAKKKYSVSGDIVFPDVALLDPELTVSLPEEVTVSTGLDAITQAFEATWSRRANPVSTAFALRAIRLGLDALPALRERPGDIELRGRMLEASLLGGLAISRSRTALCHSMSYPITAHFDLPHGLACGFTLPEVFAFNRGADDGHFQRIARDLGFTDADALESRLHRLMEELDVPGWLKKYMGERASVASLAPQMLTPGRADNNLRTATVEQVADILDRACRARGLSIGN